MKHVHLGALHLVAGRMKSSRRIFHVHTGHGYIHMIVRGVFLGAML